MWVSRKRFEALVSEVQALRAEAKALRREVDSLNLREKKPWTFDVPCPEYEFDLPDSSFLHRMIRSTAPVDAEEVIKGLIAKTKLRAEAPVKAKSAQPARIVVK